jgi:hypothetical protein
MGAEHDVDRLGAEARGFELGEKATVAAEQILEARDRPVADAGVDQDALPRRFDDQAVDRQQQVAVGVPRSRRGTGPPAARATRSRRCA